MQEGFEWTAKNPRHLMWEVRFAELKDFKVRSSNHTIDVCYCLARVNQIVYTHPVGISSHL